MKRSALTLALALFPAAAFPAGARAQQSAANAQHAAASRPAPDPADAGVEALRANWQQMAGYIAAAAADFAEADYSYRPVPSVRTVGELIGHVAGAQYMICAAALGEPARSEDAVEKAAKTKAALVKALEESTQYCARAYAQTGAAAAAEGQLFGRAVPRVRALSLNAVHDAEHYGNLVTYMRMKGMVPPSSKQ